MSDLADYGVIGIGPASGLVSGNAYVGAYSTPVTTTRIDTGGMSGVYSGSLSAQGNMVAMQLNTGSYKYRGTGRFTTTTDDRTGISTTTEEVETVPYLSGYARTYMRDPVKCTFGANSAMPALTGVMPSSLGLPGSTLYYMDLQMSRLTGSNYFDPYYFVNTIGQVVGWVTTVNNYIAALNNSEKTNLKYYRADSFNTFITQGFSKYKQGQALSKALRNQGIVAETINTGHFGTVNAVAKTMIDNGLGYINNLSDRLVQQGVVYADIYNEKYTNIINAELLNINNAADLDTIQEVLESTIVNFRNPTDYCSIEVASGLPNDSAFDTLADFGKNFHTRAPGFNVTKGSVIADLLDGIQADVPASVDALTSTETLLTQGIIDNLRSFLPVGANNGPITVLDVIGTASGYLTESLNAVNEGMEELYATSYGPLIRSKLEDISRYYARIPLNASEEYSAEHFTPPGDGSGLDYYGVKLNESKDAYFALLDSLVADNTGRIPAIVAKINENYSFVCQQLYYEFQNYNKAGITSSSYQNNSAVLGFVSSLPGYAVDSQNLGSDLMIYGITQANDSGDLVRTILNQSKNNSALSTAGVQITGVV